MKREKKLFSASIKNSKQKIVFIVSQGGSDKTTLVNYFNKHPVKKGYFLILTIERKQNHLQKMHQ